MCNNTPTNGSVSDVTAADISNITPENAAAIAAANLNSDTNCATNNTSETGIWSDVYNAAPLSDSPMNPTVS
jgi:hypothetical protein